MPTRVLVRAWVVALVLAMSACASQAPASAPTSAAAIASPSTGIEAAPVSHVIDITSADVPMPAIPTVQLPPDSPQRIVSLAKGVGETLAALGVGSRVVGRDETSDSAELAGAELVTKAHSASAEKVLSLKPDLVLIDASTTPPEAIAQIRDAGVPVVEVPEAWTLTDIAARTHAVSAAAGVPVATADQVIAEAVGGGATIAPGGPTVLFLYVRGTSAIYLVGGKGSGADALIAAAGATDAGAAAGYDAFVPLTAEAVATLDPDVILVMAKGLESVGGVDGLVALPGVAQTTAGRERRIVAVDDTLLLSFGPRTGRLVDALRAAIEQSAG